MSTIKSLNPLGPRERLEGFITSYERLHPRQPLEDSIYGLQVGEDGEAELRLSDLKALLAHIDTHRALLVTLLIKENLSEEALERITAAHAIVGDF